MRERYSVAKQNYTNKHEFVVLAVVAMQAVHDDHIKRTLIFHNN